MGNFVNNNLYLYEEGACCGSVLYHEGEYHVFYIAQNYTCIRHYRGESLINLKKSEDVIDDHKKVHCVCSYVKNGILYVVFSSGNKAKIYVAKSKDWQSFEVNDAEDIKASGLESFKIAQSQDAMYLLTSERNQKKCIRVYASGNAYVWEPLGFALDCENAEVVSPSILGVNDYQFLIYETNGLIYAQKGSFNKETGEFSKLEDAKYLDKGYNPKVYALSNGKVMLVFDINGNIVIQDVAAFGGLTLSANSERLVKLIPKKFEDKNVKLESVLVDELKLESEYEFTFNILEKSSFILFVRHNVLKQVYVSYNSEFGNIIFSEKAINESSEHRSKFIGESDKIKIRIVFSNNIGQIYINDGSVAFTFNANEFLPSNISTTTSHPMSVEIKRYDYIGKLPTEKDGEILLDL